MRCRCDDVEWNDEGVAVAVHCPEHDDKQLIDDPAPAEEQPAEQAHIDALARVFEEALNPAAQTVNTGLANIGSRQAVVRLLKAVRDPRNAKHLAALNVLLVINDAVASFHPEWES